MCDQAPAVFGERAHAAFASSVADLIGGSALQDQLADFFIRIHPFKNGVASEEAGIATFAATDGFENGFIGCNPELEFELLRSFGVIGLFTMRAQHAHEALGEHGFERGGDEIRFHAHIHEAGEGTGRIVRVQGGENQVASQRRLHRDLRGFGITNFADENHVGIVTQNRA